MKGTLLWLVFLFVSGVSSAQPTVIFDTDMGSDCDDAGALAILHKLADKGEVKILGVVFSSGRNKYGAGVCDAINTYYGRGDLPIGQYKGDNVGDKGDSYSSAIAKDMIRFPHRVIDSCADLANVYKSILAKQKDHSVTIVTVGHPNGLYQVWRDKEGNQLLRSKVKQWVAMAYCDTIPKRDWNFGKNGGEQCIAALLKEWPLPVYISQYGTTILTGNQKLPSTSDNNPVREAYRLWKNSLATGRASWDPIAVLFAVRPQLFEVEDGNLKQNAEYQTYWIPGKNQGGQQHRVKPKLPDPELQDMLEALMAEPPLRQTGLKKQ